MSWPAILVIIIGKYSQDNFHVTFENCEKFTLVNISTFTIVVALIFHTSVINVTEFNQVITVMFSNFMCIMIFQILVCNGILVYSETCVLHTSCDHSQVS